MAKLKNIVIEDAKIIFRNFGGKESRFNSAGRRNFGVLIDNDEAKDLEEEGWHIKWLKPREEGEEPQAYLPVRVNYAAVPPTVYMVTSRKKTLMSEKNIATLDNADLKTANIVISPYFWTIQGGRGKEDEHGITAYLKTGYFEIVEDPFFEKYAKYDDPDIKDPDDGADEIPFE